MIQPPCIESQGKIDLNESIMYVYCNVYLNAYITNKTSFLSVILVRLHYEGYLYCVFCIYYSWFHEKGFFSAHSFSEQYLSIPDHTSSGGNHNHA